MTKSPPQYAILLVSQDQSLIEWIKSKLSSHYKITTEITTEKGLKQIATSSYSLVIVDDSLPHEGYLLFCRHGRKSSLPTLTILEKNNDTAFTRAFEEGGTDCIRKPLELQELMARIGHAINGIDNEVRDLIFDLKEKSESDPLTHLGNRLALRKQGVREIAKAKRTEQPLSLLMIDIDHFKRINDSYGHLAGDDVLVGIAERLRKCLRKYDLITRYGGDELVLLLPNTTNTQAYQVATKILSQITCSPLSTKKGSFTITLSIGIGSLLYTEDLTDEKQLQKLLEDADQALYRAKNNGRNRVEMQQHT